MCCAVHGVANSQTRQTDFHSPLYIKYISIKDLLYSKKELSNQSILKEISLGCSLEGIMLKLKLQHFGHLMQRVDHWVGSDAWMDWRQEEKANRQ